MTVEDRFGANLRAARHAAGLTQEELAARCELHPTTVSEIERGLRRTFVDTQVKLADALGTTPTELCRGIHWDEKGSDFRIDAEDPA